MSDLLKDDPRVAGIIEAERARINGTLDLIASENHAPESIMEAQGSVFNAKAAEGYPGRRFHSGCALADELESLAISRAKQLFGAEHANVQPHSGVSANLPVYFSVLEVGDRVLSMKLSHGGHLSHGDPASTTSRCFRFSHYSVNRETELIDYDEVSRLAREFRPKMIVAGASSYSRLIDYPKMAAIARDVSAYLMVDMAHIAGLVAAKVIPSPVPYSDFVTFTTYKTLRGGRGGVILCRERYADRIDRAIFPGSQGTPTLNLVAAKAVCFNLAMKPDFVNLQERTLENAACLAVELGRRGYRVVSGGTENHMVLVDLRPKGLKGSVAEEVLESVGILVNRNVVPYDPENPTITSGIRLGVPSITSRGMGKSEVARIAELIDVALSNRARKDVLDRVNREISGLCERFPVYTG